MTPILVLVLILLFIIGLIKAFWLYDEYQYRRSQDADVVPPDDK